MKQTNNQRHCHKLGLNYTYLCSCFDSDDPCENAREDTNTLKIEDEDSNSVERLQSRDLLGPIVLSLSFGSRDHAKVSPSTTH